MEDCVPYDLVLTYIDPVSRSCVRSEDKYDSSKEDRINVLAESRPVPNTMSLIEPSNERAVWETN